MIDLNKPVTNDRLVEIFDELQQNETREIQNEMIDEIVMRANFLCPVTMTPKPEPDEAGKLTLTADTRIGFLSIQDQKQEPYFVAFTDWPQFEKWPHDDSVQTLVCTFDAYADLLLSQDCSVKGFVINPYTHNILLTKEMIAAFKKEKDRRLAVHPHTVGEGEKILLGEPQEAPVQLLEELSHYFKTKSHILSATLQQMVVKDEPSYLLVIEAEKKAEDDFAEIAKVAIPYSKLPVHMVSSVSELGVKALEKAKPFYQK